MIKNDKINDAYKTISEVTKELDLIDKKTGVLQTHTIRFWEKQFKQIKPQVRAGNRRYYSNKDIQVIKFIKFLLKEKGMTIDGVKKILSNKNTSLDDNISLGVYNHNQKRANIIKNKIKNISKIVEDLKNLK